MGATMQRDPLIRRQKTDPKDDFKHTWRVAMPIIVGLGVLSVLINFLT